MTFEELGLREEVLKSLKELGFEAPTPIQEQAIPHLMKDDCDFVGLAQTGTGKTAAFGLPLINSIKAFNSKVSIFSLRKSNNSPSISRVKEMMMKPLSSIKKLIQ